MPAVQTVFLDRDGVINRKLPEGRYVGRWEEFEFLPRAIQALRRLQQAGWRLIVVTNQRGVALGRHTRADLDAVHRRMRAELKKEGVALAAIYTCPHDEGCCDCRKPRPGLFLQAQAHYPDIDFRRAVVVGDSLCDLRAGAQLGCRTFLVADGQRRNEVLAAASELGIAVDGSAPSLFDVAASFLVGDRAAV